MGLKTKGTVKLLLKSKKLKKFTIQFENSITNQLTIKDIPLKDYERWFPKSRPRQARKGVPGYILPNGEFTTNEKFEAKNLVDKGKTFKLGHLPNKLKYAK